MSEKQYRDKITSIKKSQANEESDLRKARTAAAKHRADANQRSGKITPRTSESMARTYHRGAAAAEGKALAEDKKVETAATKLGRLACDLASAETSLDREVRATAGRAEAARKSTARKQEQDDNKRRQMEKRHAQDLARVSQPRVVHEVREVPAPTPEILRVLYLTANPEMNLRVDAEVSLVDQEVRAALHRDLIQVVHRPAATPEALLEGLNNVRPHVVHFSGHAGGATLVFDNASVDTPEGRTMPFELLARALASTDTPPRLLVLNGCDTLDGAEVFLDATPVVIAMAAGITDLAAANFAARFYAAIAAAQPVQAALDQGALALEFMDLGEGWKPNSLTRVGVSLKDLVLVKVPT